MAAPTAQRFAASRRVSPEQVHIRLSEFIEERLKIQHRFVAEPVFAKTGVGFMRSVGVTEVRRAKTARGSNASGK